MSTLPFLPLSKLSRPLRWVVLAVLSALFVLILMWIRLPAALLVGPMIAGILVETGGAEIKLPRLPFYVAQSVIGCLVASFLTADILHEFLQKWPVFLAVVLVIILFNCTLGWMLSRFHVLPGTTAIWGLLPGAASAMMLMAESYGGDARLVAFMQYMRVVIVAILASLIARFWIHATGTPAPVVWFPEMHWLGFVETLLIIVGGIVLGLRLKLPAGILLVPLFIGTALHASGLVEIVLPRWLLAAAFLALGWRIGLQFTRDVLAHAAKALPQTILAIFAVIAFCACVGLVLGHVMDIDPLTAYLATSPGGIDAVAIIAASTKINVGFIMALQCARFLLVLFIGPVLSRFLADKITSKSV